MNDLRQEFLEGQRKLLMDRSVEGRLGVSLLTSDVPEQPLPDESLIRKDLDFPELTEGEIVRYFSILSQFNFSIDHNFYPLGSCTMKYNPKVNDEIVSMKAFTEVHPLQVDSTVQGSLNILWNLQEQLKEITGMDAVSLSPMAGADGELAGMLMTRAYHAERNDFQRTKVLIPDSAHGTNPATATMAGFQVVSLPSDENGNTDLNKLRATVGEDLAGLMITLPSTLGLFDSNIEEVVKIVKDAGGIVYGDGANLNALLGKVKLGDIGFDVMHSNLHKTFTQPHGGGGPGAGPVIVAERLRPYLPAPVISRRLDNKKEYFYELHDPSKPIGRMGAFHGNFAALVRAYAYISTLGREGITAISDDAVINANYISESLKNYFDLPYDRRCMHEVVLSARNLKNQFGVTAMDVAKRLIDYGIHPPTMYFPLIVDEALMIEPTETESKETLDYFIRVMKTIYHEAETMPQVLFDAPHFATNTRLDEALAARRPELRWNRKDA